MSSVPALHPDPGHPAAVVAGVHEMLDGLGSVEDVGLGSLAGLVAECARARSRLQALELELVALADRSSVARRSGARDTGSWLAAQTRSEPAQSARDTRLAVDLFEQLEVLKGALGAGDVSTEHAHVIAGAMRQLPAGLSPAQRAVVEAGLTEDARAVDPATLRRRARRALAAVESDPAVVDAHEDALVGDEEARARARSRLTLHDNGDGTTSGHFIVPVVAGGILRKVIDAMTSPRRGRRGATLAQAGDRSIGRDPAHDRGLAFAQVLEHLPTDHLPAKVAATLLVSVSFESLTGQLKAAGIDTGERVSAGESRRLACGAGILPAVLGGRSQPLDLGRSRRLFSQTQCAAAALVHHTCAADGCDLPFAWCELHHRDPWASGGRTDLDRLIPLCGFHHHRIHDRAFDHRHRPDGAVTFHRRT